ncbi:site-specific integrase [Paraburkholderia sp. SARCC-3016]|uniref:site-specific integrase n=1 Tax=Paraburkholderia sp. SARCC-3016 TaxID=3058611 RepID=UPI0028093773|nr:site-specific integrase [Paraburkholderia sp. SARCC-3016]MDQ7982176.1 site-specific integrase [Paraburkholderia sp. SARCC-3016]
MSEHVVKRGNRYYYRRRVPVDLIAAYGKAEHQQALGTSDRREADRRARAAGVELDALFDKLRAALGTTATAPISAANTAERAVSGSWTHMRAEEWGDPDHNSLDDEARDARIDEMKEAVRRVLGDYSMRGLGTDLVPPAVLSAMEAKGNTPTADTKTAERSLDVLVRLWEKDRKPESRAALSFHRAVDRFKQYVGNPPVPRITKAQVVALKDALEVAGIGPTSIDQTLNNLRTLFAYAIGKAWIEPNPGRGVKREGKRKHARGARPPFDLATINRIFAHRIYTEGYRPVRGRGEAAYWLPLLGLFTGARVEELCQLRPEDVYAEDYRDANGAHAQAWVLKLVDNEEHGQGVKNAYSVRRIPLHPVLIELGFPEFAAQQLGKPRLFHLLRKDKHGVESSLWSAWWISDVLRAECEPTSPKMVFHSFRHTFKDVCRDCGISKELADALQGHSEGDSSSDYGGEFYPLRPLIEAMSKYKIHGLKIVGVESP